MTSILDQVTHGIEDRPRRILVYGVHGIGKSTFAAGSDQPIFIPTEDGLGNIDCAKFPICSEYSTVIEYLGALHKEDHSYKTVVIDSLDWLETLIWRATCQDHGKESIEDFAYAKGYVFAVEKWRRVIECLEWLRRDKSMHALLIAHAQVKRYDNPETEAYDRYEPKLNKHASAFVQEWADEVLFANWKVYVKTTDVGFNQERHRGIATGERLLYTSEKPGYLAKNRLGLPESIPMDYSVYNNLLAGVIANGS